MSLSYLKSNRTRYKNLLERELALGKNLIEEEKEEIDLKYLCTKVDACIRRLTDFCEKLDTTNEKLSLAISGIDGVEDLHQSINEDCSFMSSVIDCRDQLVTLQKYTLGVKSPSENASTVTIAEERLSQLEQMTAQMQQLLIGHQNIIVQQQQQQRQNTKVDLLISQNWTFLHLMVIS